eukprot:jgi/Picsp_1/6547/NSC_03890-R1_conserved oligomeric golgi complex subunit 2-like
MQVASANWSDNSVATVWFDASVFDKDEFDSCKYVDDLKRYVPLDTLRLKLTNHADEMRFKLVEVVNEDYDEFAALSTKLVNVDAAILELERPIMSMRKEVEEVKLKIIRHAASLNETIQRRQSASEVRGLLELAQDAIHSLSKVEKLAQSLEEESESFRVQGTNIPHERLCKTLDRICSEMGRLLFFLHDYSDMVVIQRMSQPVQELKNSLQYKLRDALIQVLQEQDPSSLGTLLHAYASVGSHTLAENIIREVIVRPFVENAITRITSQNQKDNLYNTVSAADLLDEMILALQEDFWPFLEAVTSAGNASLPFDFPGRVIFPEVIGSVEACCPSMYSPGNPNEFHGSFCQAQKLGNALESLCTTKSQIIRFRSSDAWKTNKSKWNLAAYFSLKFQEIAAEFERGLTDMPEQLTLAHDAFHCVATVRCYASIQKCVDPQIWLLPMADKFIRLQLQLLSRYFKWIDDFLLAGVGDHPRASAQKAFYLYLDTKLLEIKMKEDNLSKLTGSFEGNASLPRVLQLAFHDSHTHLREAGVKVLEFCARQVSSQCCECMGQIRGIVATFRMTARAPTGAAQYAKMILQPLQDFLKQDGIQQADEGLKDELKCLTLQMTTETYSKIVVETLETARKTEQSLKKLKSRKALSSGTEDESLSTDKMVESQLTFDIKEYLKQGKELAGDSLQICDEEFASLERLVSQ